jgi:hypothetical protein
MHEKPVVEVADDLTLAVERDGRRIAVLLNPAEARAIAGALVHFAALTRLVSGAADPIRMETAP